MFNKFILTLKIIPKLGYWNVGYAAWYKLSLKIGLRKTLFPIEPPIDGTYFNENLKADYYPIEWKEEIIASADEIYNGVFTFFSYHKFSLGSIPDWHYDPFAKVKHSQTTTHWTRINDFGEGDIKIIWELSRFDWSTTLARAYKVTGDDKYLFRLNELINDWSQKNPLNVGPNWKCGQEASIRLMKVMTSFWIIDPKTNINKPIKTFIRQHLRRIYPNINYAIVQDNNHGTSEAAALYIGAAFLIVKGEDDKACRKWKRQGRQILEERVMYLIQEEGTFSQRSMTYHRVLMDTMTFVLHMMDILKEPPFSKAIVDRLTKLGKWQFKLTFGKDGDAPNFGSNDGAMLENTHSRGYRDFRVSTQVFFASLLHKRVYEDIEVSEAMYWRHGYQSLKWPVMEIDKPEYEILDNQMAILRKNNVNVLIKIPEATFRPGNDAFHLDMWVDGINVLRDAGSYSYNAGSISEWFKSVKAHNTVQFGSHNQMPKISRFLYGQWIEAKNFTIVKEQGEIVFRGEYKDYCSNNHHREVRLSLNQCIVKDEVVSKEQAIVRFHISPFSDSIVEIKKSESMTINDASYSLYYLHKEVSKVIEYEIVNHTSLVTIDLKALN